MLIEKLIIELHYNKKPVSTMMKDFQDTCIKRYIDEAKHYEEKKSIYVKQTESGNIVKETELEKKVREMFYKNICLGNIAKPVIFMYDREYKYNQGHDIQFIDICNPKSIQQEDLMTTTADKVFGKYGPVQYVNGESAWRRIKLSQILWIMFVQYGFDYVTIFDFGCRSLNHQISEDVIQAIIRE